ncbi:MAG TPA: hypothetical protein VGL26_07215 [Jatrophihabitans sp.]
MTFQTVGRSGLIQRFEPAEEVGKGPVGSGGIGGGVEVHEQTADDGEDERRQVRPADAAQAVLERP